jgi:glycerol kinase
VWPDRDAIRRQWKVDKQFAPQISADEAAARRATWRRAVDRAKDWARE